MRIISTVVAFTFVLSVAGTGIAVPVAPEGTLASDAATGEVTPAPDAAPPAEAPAEEPPADPSVEAPPTTTEPVHAAPNPLAREQFEAAKDRRPATQADAPRLVAAAVAPYAAFTDVEWEAYRISPASQIGWAKANLGEYHEGDWVPVRLYIDNTNGDGDLRLPSFAIDFDHYSSTKNAVGVDKARGYRFFTGATLPSGPGAPSGSSPLAGVSDSDGGTTPAYHITHTPAGDVVIPQGQYGVVHFEVHLALTPYWQQLASKSGARDYPGSSAQGRFISWNGEGTGQKTISLPVGTSTIPEGRIDGLKFNDLDHDGIKETGENGLAGFRFTLQYGGDFPFSMTATSAADGTFAFSELPAGSYTITEADKAPWVSSTANPLAVTLGRDEVTSVKFGNYIPDMTKTWTLSIDALPIGAQPFVSYALNGVPTTTDLGGTPPYASMDAEVGSTITDIEWYVRWMGEDILLGTQGDEVLDEDIDNSLTYDSSVSGSKYDDANGNGARDTSEQGLGGWTIQLKRVMGSGEFLYAQAVTASDGTYSFADVLPGTYKVYEVNQSGWYNTDAPAGSFVVASGSNVTGLDFGNLEVMASIDLEKMGPDLAHVGDTITYTLMVTNTGNFLLTDVLVSDPTLGVDETIASLAPGDTWTLNVDHVVAAGDPDPLPNTAWAGGSDVFGRPYTDTDDHTVDIIHPAIEVVKTASPATATNPAGVTYTYVVTNTGDDPLTSVTLEDDKLTVPGAYIGELAAGETVTLTVDAILTATTTNIATVSGDDSLGATVSDDDSATVEVYNPSISIAKSADPIVSTPGGAVWYSYLVTNTGDIALHDVVVNDDILGPVGAQAFLGVGQSVTFLAPANPVDDVVNIGTVTAAYGDPETEFSGTVTASSSATVDVVHPAVEIVKSASPSPTTLGSQVTYSFVVRNTGDVALTDLYVTDDKIGAIGGIGSLPVGAEVTLSAMTRLFETTYNVVTVTGEDVYGHPVTDTDDETVMVYSPSISISKTVSDETVLQGERVTYSYEVTNDGDLDLSDIEVTDDVLGDIGTIASLPVGQSVELQAEATITADVTNIGTATGHYGDLESDFHGTVTDTDDAFVNMVAPAVEIEKTASHVYALPNTPITYTYVVRNTGDVTLYDLVVTDDVIGPIGTIDELAVGAETTLTATDSFDTHTSNVAEVEGFDANENRVWDDDSAMVWIESPSISIVKSADPVVTLPGGLVGYTYVVTNTGTTPLFNVTVVDDILGPVGSTSSLAVGGSVTFMVSANPADDVTNIGTVTAEYGDSETNFYGELTASSTASVDVRHPAISIDKTVSADLVPSGTTVTYSYEVTNEGDTELHDIVVSDDVLGDIGTIASLAPGASQTLTRDAVITAPVVNVGTATGEYGEVESSFGGTVTDTDTAEVAIAGQPAVEVIKSASPSSAVAGSLITYTYLVRNTGDVTLYDLSVDDDHLGHLTTIDELAAGAETVVTGTAILTETTTNVVVVSGRDGTETPVSDEDEYTVDIYHPSISLVKSASANNIMVGQVVTYTYLVTNTGDLPLTDVVVSDDIIGYITTIPFLAAGESMPVSAPQMLVADTTNIGTATGTYFVPETETSGEVSASDEEFVNVVDPALSVEKFASAYEVTPGSSVTYTYLVTNVGDVPLIDVQVVDDKLGTLGTIAYLVPGDSRTYTADTTLAETTTNIVTATATDEFQHPVSATDTVTVEVFVPSIEVVKTASDEVILAGENVTYTYVITNTGTIALRNVDLTDDRLGDIALGDTTLDPGESTSVTMATAIAVDTVNIATVTGDYGQVESEFGGTVTDTDDAVVDVVAPAIAVTKTAAPTEILAGETVTYTYLVSNIGDVPLNDVLLTDDRLGEVGSLETLAVGASMQFTSSAALSVPTTNVVEATAVDDFGHEVSATDDAFVDVAAPFTPPDLVIDKSANKRRAAAGDTVRYTITYRNVGPSPASEMVITDDYDERYVTVTDAAGGVVSGGTITWNVPGPLTAEDGPQTITYTVKIDDELPAGLRRIRNTVLIFEPTEENTDDNDDSWEVELGDPFLPFTGGEWLLLAMAAAAATATGVTLRRAGRSRE